MRPIRSILFLLALSLGLTACESGRQFGSDGSDTTLPADPDAASGILTPTEEDIIRAFQYEVDKQWLEASVLYDKLAQSSTQPEALRISTQVALMYFEGGSTKKLILISIQLGEQDILELDLKYRETIRAGGYLGEGKIYQSLLALPEIEEIIDYRYKALALRIRSRGVLAIGKPLKAPSCGCKSASFYKHHRKLKKIMTLSGCTQPHFEPAMIRALAEQQTIEVRGWLELNLIARRSNMLPVKMEPWIDQWYQLYGDHSAAPRYAINLLEESKRIYINPTRIALMLPFSGRLEKVAGRDPEWFSVRVLPGPRAGCRPGNYQCQHRPGRIQPAIRAGNSEWC